MSKYLAKASSLASRFEQEEEIMQEAQYKWDEKTHTFSKDTQIDKNTVLSEPVTSEEYYKNSNW